MKKEKQKEQEQQELLYNLSIFEQQIHQLQQQLQLIERSILDLSSLDFGLDEIKDSAGKEILAQLGRGIFAKTKLISDDLIVDIGEKTFVKKTIPETKKLIQEQIKKLEEIKKELQDNLDEINEKLTDTFFGAH
jgi:prefoldin alpha subunit